MVEVNTTIEKYKAVKILWDEYWEEYKKNHSYYDGADYADEYEAFFEGYGIYDRL